MAEKSLDDQLKESQIAREKAELEKIKIEKEFIQKQMTEKWFSGKLAVGILSALGVLASVYLGHNLSREYDENVRESEKRALLVALSGELAANRLALENQYRLSKRMYEERISQMPAKFEPVNNIYNANSKNLGTIAQPFTVQRIAEVYMLMDVIERIRASTDEAEFTDYDQLRKKQKLYLTNVTSALFKSIQLKAAIDKLIGDIPEIGSLMVQGDEAKLFQEVQEYNKHLNETESPAKKTSIDTTVRR